MSTRLRPAAAVFLVGLVGILSASVACAKPPDKKPVAEPSGDKLFKQYCSKCHVAGGNLLKPAKPVAGSQKLATLATFRAYLASPPGHMPYYHDVVADEKLLKALYDFCKKLKETPGPKKVV